MDTPQITLRVLEYEEDGEHVALALEMDLRGYGGTKEEARTELADLILAQFSFAQMKNDPTLLWHDAEPHYWTASFPNG